MDGGWYWMDEWMDGWIDRSIYPWMDGYDIQYDD